jgi:hypothetical protein
MYNISEEYGGEDSEPCEGVVDSLKDECVNEQQYRDVNNNYDDWSHPM